MSRSASVGGSLLAPILAPILAIALALVAFAAREHAGADRRLPAGETLEAPGASEVPADGATWCVDDARSAWHMRRVELALAARRLPSFDRSIEHPDGREAPDGPLFAALLAFVGERAAPRDGDPSLSGVDERGLERTLAHASPLLGALAVLAACAAGAALARPERRLAAGLAAGATYALAPAALAAGAAGHLDERVWLDLLLAVHAYLVTRALGAREALDRMQGALVAGLVAGLAVASSPAGLLVAWTGQAGFLLSLAARDELRAHRTARDGLMYGLAACGASAVVGLEGPWELGPRAAQAAHAASGVLALGTLPFVFGTFSPSRLARRGLAWIAGLVALAAGVAFLPGLAHGLGEVWALGREASALLGVDGVDGVASGRGGLAALGVLLALALAVSLATFARGPGVEGGAGDEPDRRPVLARPAAQVAWIVACAWLVAALLDRAFVPELALATGCVVALAVDALPERRLARPALAAALLLLLGLPALRSLPATRGEDELARRDATLRVLRAMRTGTPSPGAWNAASTRKDWGVLAPPSLGLLVAYHARRPAVDVGLALDAGRAHAVAEAWRATDAGQLAERARGLEAAFVALGPTWLDDVAAGPAATALALATPGEAPPAGWSRALASGLAATREGGAETVSGAAGAVLSVWGVPGAERRTTRQPELRAR